LKERRYWWGDGRWLFVIGNWLLMWKKPLQILTLKPNQDPEEESKIVIPEQFMNLQKVAYDICKISERIWL
jgi:hypothetical protein